MSELRDVVLVFSEHERRLDAGDKKLSEHDAAHAKTAEHLARLDNQIEVFRDGINQYCQRLRRELQDALRAINGSGR